MSYKEYKAGIIDKSEWAYDNRDYFRETLTPNERCETCRWWIDSKAADCDICMNINSELCGEDTGWEDYCERWERK